MRQRKTFTSQHGVIVHTEYHRYDIIILKEHTNIYKRHKQLTKYALTPTPTQEEQSHLTFIHLVSPISLISAVHCL